MRKQAIPGVKKEASSTFARIFVLLCAWGVGGAYLDGWAHLNGAVESFFTPWHAVLYSGVLAQATFLIGAFIRNRHRGQVPDLAPAYRVSLIGIAVFLTGGVADMLWHLVFGIEADVEALLSPTHLILGLGSVLIVTGPFRDWWRSDRATRGESIIQAWPALLSLTLLLSLFTFFTQYAHPWANPLASLQFQTNQDLLVFYRQALGVASIMLQAAILAGLVLFTTRQGGLPPGSLTLVITVNAIMMGLMRERLEFVPAALLAGLIGDSLMARLQPFTNNVWRLRVFAFALPAELYVLYFATLALTDGIWWSIPLWTGSIFLAGIIGWLLSYLQADR